MIKLKLNDMAITKTNDIVLIKDIQKDKILVDNNVNDYFIKLNDIREVF